MNGINSRVWESKIIEITNLFINSVSEGVIGPAGPVKPACLPVISYKSTLYIYSYNQLASLIDRDIDNIYLYI